MPIIDEIYKLILVQPAYNFVMWAYNTLGQNEAGLTAIAIGIFAALFFIPVMLAGYFDQQRTRQLQTQITAIEENEPDDDKRQEKILKLLHKKNIRFQSESIFLGGIAVFLAWLYPVFTGYWQEFHPDLLYPFVVDPEKFSPYLGGINLGYSSAELSLIPAILLYFELRQSYQEQKFLTSFIDRWYAVILPLFVYFLIFWLPSALSVILAAAIGVSLYIRFLLQFFTSLRHKKRASRAQ